MKKFISTALLCTTSMIFAQKITFSGKANLLFPTEKASWQGIKNTTQQAYSEGGKNNVGFNVGLSAKIDLPTSLFVMPEIYFTSFKSEFTEPNTSTTLKSKSNRIDVPILVGTNVLGKMIGVFVGPVASYNLTGDETYDSFKEDVKNNFTVGYQLGAQAKIEKLIINARYEGSFSKDQRSFINSVSNSDVSYDNRPSLFIVGLGYSF